MERARRLRKGEPFEAVYRQGTAISGPFVVLRVLPRAGGPTRWGFAVGKRLSKKAVARNRTRRRLREAARALPVREGYDLVVTARGGAIEASYGELQRALERVLARAKLLEGQAERLAGTGGEAERP